MSPIRLAARIRPAAIALLVIATACSSPTAPSDQVVAAIGGTVQPGAFDIQRFFLMKAGAFEFRLQALTPGAAARIGIGFGTLTITGRDCFTTGTPTVSAANVGQAVMWPTGPGMTKTQVDMFEGAHCVKVFDPGFYDPTIPQLDAPQNYTLQLVEIG